MTYENFERLLKAVYAEYLLLEDDCKAGACERTLAILGNMIREKDGRKRKLAEIGSTGEAKRSNAKRARGKLVQQTNASSPQSPLKPVKTTKKNELRR
ncbi:hypothetical protein [Ruegeria atlantica]|uniref:hypothetical protein n=1 Tax=Ruegeria atlantica TaxID=81569 RepID=UPI00147DCD8F|nr:hypothetical protein [Ruegeria atlantica]